MRSFAKLASFVCVCLILLVVLAHNKEPTTPTKPSCKSDWRRCIDNTELVNNFEGIWGIKYDCRDQANKLAKYGDPKWPSYGYFGSYFANEHFLPSKRITLIEKDAQYQNGFGAFRHVGVRCVYDLEGGRVVSVNLVES